ncbi:MAG: hybrid sensor histidine kinase/response regulator [Bacteroidales bacterium]|nr:hybrid sensor histidine kinase/response regulator [Bacteroidales bacterium]
MNILVVDDNPRNIQIVGNLLKEQNLKIAFATDGSKALELTREHEFDLILLDVMMPGMDGFEVCRKLRTDNRSKNIPIIFLTAKTDSASVVKGFEIGANDYVTKPFNSHELLARVKTQLELSSKRKQLDQLNRNLEKKVAERTIELANANRRLLRLEKSKSDFLSVISHELRTPLNTLTGITHLLQNTPLTDEQQDYLQAIELASARLARFSEMALLITSLQTGGQLPEMFDLKVNLLFEIAVFELRQAIEEKKIHTKITLPLEEIMLFGDAELIRKCLIILIENAIKQLPEGGTVMLEAAILPDNRINLHVSDNGPGFPADILEVFGETVPSRDNLVRNMGALSLTAVKLIMDVHGGSMKIENNPNGGAKVNLLFAGKE